MRIFLQINHWKYVSLYEYTHMCLCSHTHHHTHTCTHRHSTRLRRSSGGSKICLRLTIEDLKCQPYADRTEPANTPTGQKNSRLEHLFQDPHRPGMREEWKFDTTTNKSKEKEEQSSIRSTFPVQNIVQKWILLSSCCVWLEWTAAECGVTISWFFLCKSSQTGLISFLFSFFVLCFCYLSLYPGTHLKKNEIGNNIHA